MRKANKYRAARGNMIVVISAILIGIVMLVIAFSFNFARLLGGQQGQQTAIQAAALAAAQDVGKIVVATNDFGWISLSDDAPIGTLTDAGDQYFLPVRGVNTIVATTRLDYLIGQKLGDPIMMGLAQQDFTNLQKNALPQLEAALADSIAGPAGTGQDINNNTIAPYADAEQAFINNLKKYESGTNCQYVSGSLKLSIGCLTQGIATNLKVPLSGGTMQANSNQQQNGYYLSDTDLTVGSIPFALGAIGANVRLVEQTKFSPAPVTTFGIPAVIKAEADQLVTNSQKANMTVHATACAQPANVYDPRPAPGAFVLSFPDGQPPGVNTLADCVRPGLISGNATLLSPSPGDYPTNVPPCLMRPMTWMLGGGGNPAMTDAIKAGFYDWLRRAGSKADIDSVVGMMTQPVTSTGAQKDWKTQLTVPGTIYDLTTGLGVSNPLIPVGTEHLWEFDINGVLHYTYVPNITPYEYTVESENQMYAEDVGALNNTSLPTLKFTGLTAIIKSIHSGNATITITNTFDAYLRDQCRWVGTVAGGSHFGGKHGGEPLDNLPPRTGVVLTVAPTPLPVQTGGPGQGSVPLLGNQSDFNELMGGDKTAYASFSTGPGANNGIRPTYQTTGTAVELRFRRQMNVDASILDALSVVTIGDNGYLSEEF